MLCGYVIGNQLFADFLKGSGFFLAFRLCLKQHNGANILLAHGIFGCGEFFQLVSQVDCVQNDLCLTVAVVDDDGWLYHVFVFQLHRVHITEDDIIVCDPEAEYFPLVQKLGGQVIRISPVSTDYINPLDINTNYSEEENPLTLKSDFTPVAVPFCVCL